MSRAVAEMMPAVTLPPRPNGLPIASTQSPTRALAESPHAAAGSGVLASIFSKARSVTASRPMTCACIVVSSDRVTVICSALAITWLLVTISPAGSMMKPEPSEAVRGGPEPPGPPLSPKKSRKNSSSGAPGVPGEFWGASCDVLAAGPTAWVETLTTTPTSRPASCAKTSANGPSGGCAQLGAATIVHNANDAAKAAPRRPKNLTTILPSPPGSRVWHRNRETRCPYRRTGSGAPDLVLAFSGALDMKWRRLWQD